ESDGKIAKSKWVENTYYVDENGQMLKNTFTPDGYYVGDDGKYVDLNLNNINAQVNSNSLSEQIKNAKLLTEYSEDTLIDQIDTVKFGSYPQSDASGNTKDPIEWIVLDRQKDRALLMSKSILDNRSYNDEYTDVTWEICTLRNWLNNDFYYMAFNSDEQNKILTTSVINNNNIDYDTNGGNITDDKIFCLSIEEVRKYFGDGVKEEGYYIYQLGKNVATQGTSYAKAVDNKGSNLFVYDGSGDSQYSWVVGISGYWLRSPGDVQSYATYVGAILNVRGVDVNFSNYGVRPALWVSY
ncbi:MAG: hypothetical protein J6P02_05640, partial [Lachnospiraceae bacterium]|nr:hypothetical protein [Lachnospiraceae bacterium]